jgi:hypothetical protein
MDRVSPAIKRRSFQLGIAAFCLGLSFLAGTCDNPVDLLGEVEVKVMKANKRYLEVVGIRALSLLTDQSVSPGSVIEVQFDRPFDPSTVSSNLSVKTLGGSSAVVAIDPKAPSNILRFKPEPYYIGNSDYILLLSNVSGADGSVMSDSISWSFRTGVAPAGFLKLTAKDSDTLTGYTREELISASVEANELVSKFALANTPEALEPPPEDGLQWLSVSGAADCDWNLADQTQGSHTVYARFRQYTGSVYVYSEVVSATISFDNIPPAVSAITNNYAGSSQSYLKTGSFVFTASITNGGTSPSPIRYVWFYKDTVSGSTTENKVAEDATAEFQWVWNTGSDAEGAYYIKARVRDGAGNWSAVNYNNLRYVDKTAPIFSSFTLNGGSAYTTNAAITASMNVSGAYDMCFSLYTYTGSGWRFDATTPYVPYAPSYSLTLASDDQNKWVYLYARDLAGNQASSGGSTPYDTIILDTVPPTAPTVTVTPGFYDTTPTWSWSGGGGGNGIYKYALDGGTAIETSATSFTPPSALSEASHSLAVWERDAAGNWSAASTRSVRVTQVLPYDGQTRVSRTPTLEWRAFSSATSYELQVQVGIKSWNTIITQAGRAYSIPKLNELSGNTTYTWRVIARNFSGDTLGYIPDSSGASFTTGY